MSHHVELEENVAIKPKGWGYDTDKEFPFHHLTGPGKAFFVKLNYDDDTTEEEIKDQELSLKRKLYQRATHAGKKIEIRRHMNEHGIKGLRVHYKEENSQVDNSSDED